VLEIGSELTEGPWFGAPLVVGKYVVPIVGDTLRLGVLLVVGVPVPPVGAVYIPGAALDIGPVVGAALVVDDPVVPLVGDALILGAALVVGAPVPPLGNSLILGSALTVASGVGAVLLDANTVVLVVGGSVGAALVVGVPVHPVGVALVLGAALTVKPGVGAMLWLVVGDKLSPDTGLALVIDELTVLFLLVPARERKLSSSSCRYEELSLSYRARE
jgi:hypothetical protein